MTLDDLQQTLRRFREVRGWQPDHTPRKLAAALSVEAAELLELFLWDAAPSDERIGAELADVVIYALNIADVLGLDLGETVLSKIECNEQRFPIQGRGGW
jgi:NTP pyrophosphatase (non-canonical NTP hydrolase)